MGNNCSEQACTRIGPGWVRCVPEGDISGLCQCCNVTSVPQSEPEPILPHSVPAAIGTVVYQDQPVGVLSQGHGIVEKDGEPHTYLYFKLIIDGLPESPYNVEIDQIIDFTFSNMNLTMRAVDANDPMISYKIVITLSYDLRYFLDLKFIGFKEVGRPVGQGRCGPWVCKEKLFELDFNVLPVVPAPTPSSPPTV